MFMPQVLLWLRYDSESSERHTSSDISTKLLYPYHYIIPRLSTYCQLVLYGLYWVDDRRDRFTRVMRCITPVALSFSLFYHLPKPPYQPLMKGYKSPQNDRGASPKHPRRLMLSAAGVTLEVLPARNGLLGCFGDKAY